MLQDMAVIDEIARIRPTKIHAESHAGKWMIGVAVPGGDVNRIEKLSHDRRIRGGSIDLEVLLIANEKMDLMNMKLVPLQGTILDGPVLN